MKTKFKSFLPFLTLIILVISLFFSATLRKTGYYLIPDNYVILDERAIVWAGLGIRQSGIPAAWSILGAYSKGINGGTDRFNLTADDKSPSFFNFKNFPKPVKGVVSIDYREGAILQTPLVQPWLDHPPLGTLILSSAVSSQVNTFTDVTPYQFRKTSLYLAIITGILIYFLGWQIFKNPLIGLLAAVIYGSGPVFLLLSRYALLENVLNPLLLLCLNLLVFANNLRKKHKNFRLAGVLIFVAGVTAGLSALVKVSGWSLLPIGILLLHFWKSGRKNILRFSIPAVLIGLLYVVWGLYLSPEVFLNIIQYQAIDRGFIGSINFLVTLTQIGIKNFPLDGWWTGGFIALLLMPRQKQFLPIFVGSVIFLLSGLALGGANYPWYFIPMIPFFALAAAHLIWRIAVKPTLVDILVFFLLFFSSSFYWGYGVYRAALQATNYQQPFLLYRLFLIFFLLSAAFWKIFSSLQKKSLKTFWFILILAICLLIFYWNVRSFRFILINWGKLPLIYTPGTFTSIP